MNSLDTLEGGVLSAIALWQGQGLGVTLATILRTHGSAPHEAGTLYAINARGEQIGALSGTCLGAWLNRHITNGLKAPLETIRVGEDEGIRLPCGGTIDILLEKDPPPAHIEEWRMALINRACIHRTVDIGTRAYKLSRARVWQRPRFDGRVWAATYGPSWRILIIGAGAVSAHLARLALMLDFSVTISEPRIEMREEFDEEGALLTSAMPDDAVTAIHPDFRTAILALAHDPRLDDLGLWEALQTNAFYIGALGSVSSHRKRCTRLATLGIPSEQLERIHGPAGLPILSRTPVEIAVAIAGALIAEKHHEHPRNHDLSPPLTEAFQHDHRTPSCGRTQPPFWLPKAPSTSP